MEWKERTLSGVIEREKDPVKLIDWRIFKAVPIFGFRRTEKTFLLRSKSLVFSMIIKKNN